MITQRIRAILTAADTLPNSYAKNKLKSHLQDALVWSMYLDEKQDKANHVYGNGACNCPAGAIRSDCPAHNTQVKG